MEAAGARTAGEYLSKLDKQRNGNETYDRMLSRDMLREEVAKIFEAQRNYGNEKATEKLEEKYTEIAFTQRPLQSFANMVGECTFFPEEKRAAKNAPSAELFVMWSELNKLHIKSKYGEVIELTADEKQRIYNLALENESDVTYAAIRKELKIDDESRFNLVGYRSKKKKASFIQLKGYHEFKKALRNGSDAKWQNFFENEREKLDKAAAILAFVNDEEEIKEKLAELEFSDDEIEKLLYITDFSGTINLSLKAVGEVLPYLEEGYLYNEACEKAGLDFKAQYKGKKYNLLPPFPDLRNPVVNKSLSQARKVINGCIRKYGMPDKIIVELAREVGKSHSDRKKIKDMQDKNRKNNEKAKEHMRELLGSEPRGGDVLKYRLWKEQNGYCPYSGQYIDNEMLRDGTAVQVDHILPYSRTYNNSYMNKVLCLTSANQEKGNRTPYECWGGDEERWKKIEEFASKLPKAKADNLLRRELGHSTEEDFKDRNLNDTRYIAKELKNHIEKYLDFGKEDNKQRVQVRNGALTAHLRHSWGFPEYKRVNDRHHAIDAVVLACSTQDMVQKFTRWNKWEAKQKGEPPYPPKPWDSFREDLKKAVDNMFCSRQPVRKVTGQAHKETIRSIRVDKDGNRRVVQRIKLAKISKSNLENMVDKERNIKLYNTLKERLEQHGWNTEKAFAEPIHMPTKDPNKQGPQIHGIHIYTNEKSGIEINGGLASNGRMVRTDVFRKNVKGKWKYYLCPVYVHHTVSGKLPNRVISRKEWPEIDDSYEFIFSLHKNDLVRIKSKKEDYFGYFVDTDRSNGSIKVCVHDRDESFGKDREKRGIGVQDLLAFEKYQVDIFGEKTRVKKETRLGFSNMKR